MGRVAIQCVTDSLPLLFAQIALLDFLERKEDEQNQVSSRSNT